MKHPDLERYLRLATWGLWGEHRRTVRLELEAHVHHKAWKYQLQGLSETEAIARALADLGEPQVISAGMNGVYTVPNMLRNSLLCAVLATLGVGNLTSSMAQVVGTTRVPISDCAGGQQIFKVGTQPWPCVQPRLWLSLSSLRATLEPKGVKFSQPVGSPATGAMLFLRFPGTDIDITLQPEPTAYFLNGDGTKQMIPVNPDFITIRDFRAALAHSPLPVRISGWDNAIISVGATSFSLGTPDAPALGSDFYWEIISLEQLEVLFPPLIPQRQPNDREDMIFPATYPNPPLARGNDPVGYGYTLRIRDARPNDVFVVLSREGPAELITGSVDRPETIQNQRRAFIAPVDADGTLRYISPSKNLTVAGDGNLPRGVLDGAGVISVLRFSGRVDLNAQNALTRVDPKDVTVQAMK